MKNSSPTKACRTWKTATEAFGDCRRGLKVRKPWLDQILSGSKTIEIRGGASPHLGKVLLVEVKSKRIRGSVDIMKSRPLTAEEMKEHSQAISTLTSYGSFWAWELENARELQNPIEVPPEVARGSVTWLTKERWEAFDRCARK